MKGLDDAMLQQIRYLVLIERRPFSYLDFCSEAVKGQPYAMAHGTYRNKVSKFRKLGILEQEYNAGTAFQTLKGEHFGKRKKKMMMTPSMTPNHMGVSPVTGVINKNDEISKSAIYKAIQELPPEQKSAHDIHLTYTVPDIYTILTVTPVTKEHRIRLAQDYALDNGKQSDVVQREEDRVIQNVRAYKLFDEGKNPLEVASELNLSGPQVQQFYSEYWNLKKMHKLVTIYQEIQDSIEYFLKLFRLGKKEGLTPEQIINLVQMADSIHKLQDRLQQLQSEVLDISRRQSVGQEKLKSLHKEISGTQEKLDLVRKTFNMKYGELKEACSQAQKLQNYVEQFKDSQDYQELESIVRSEVGEILLDNKKLLQNALVSVVVALRNDPDRHLLIDRMELTPFTTNTIINYNSFLALRRPSCRQGNEQFATGRVLGIAEKVLNNVQKCIVDSTISTAAGLEKGGSYSATYQALPYYQWTNVSEYNANSIE